MWARSRTYRTQTSDLQSIFFSSADNWSTRTPYWKTSPRKRGHKVYNFTPQKPISSPVRPQNEQETTRWQFKVKNIEILTTKRKVNYFDQLIAFKKCRTSRVWTPHQIRVVNRQVDFTQDTYWGTDSNSSTSLWPSSLLYASRTWTMTEQIKTKLQLTRRRMMMIITQIQRQTNKNGAVTYAVSVDVNADVGTPSFWQRTWRRHDRT